MKDLGAERLRDLFLSRSVLRCTGMGNKTGVPERGEVMRMDNETGKRALLDHLLELAQWRNNDVVKLAFLEDGDGGEVDGLDLTGVVELKRHPNGAFEVKLVDRVRVLAMLRELLEQQDDGRLEEFMDALKAAGDGDEG